MSRRRIVIAAMVIVAATTFFLLTRGPAKSIPNPPGTFSFAALGDAPYYFWEDWQYRVLLQELDSNDLSWTLQVGDILWRPCSEGRFRKSLEWYEALSHPVVFTPGDNEWTNCWEPGSGGFAPLERLDVLRRVFYAEPHQSMGQQKLALQTQADDPQFSTYVEHARWSHRGMIFATVHLVGSWNGLAGFEGRTKADDVEAKERTAAAAAWTRETFAAARSQNADAVVIAFHANPIFENRPEDRYRRTFEPFLAVFEEEAEAFGKPVLVIHGDHHEFTVDHPVTRRGDGKTLTNVTRLQVPGSPRVGWVRVTVTPGAEEPFAFREHLMPRWKLW